jgi:malate synthase
VVRELRIHAALKRSMDPAITDTEDRLLTPDVVKLVHELTQRFSPRREELLMARQLRRAAFREGIVARLDETAHVRQARWMVDPVPAELLERRVELLGGCTRQEIIQGMNAGAKSYVADLWNMSLTDGASVLKAHKNLERAVENRLIYVGNDGDRLRIDPQSITRIMLVPRPLHVWEGSVRSAGLAVPAAFFDLAVFACLNAVKLRVRQGGVYLYLRGVHGHLEARLWKELFEHVEEYLSLPRGTIRATVMMDSLAAALEADEILFELMHHSAGLSLDPQAYAADHIELFAAPDRAVLPDRERIGLNAHFLRSVSLMTIGTCHRRQAHAIGAPAFILPPDEEGRQRAGHLDMIADKEREAVDGHDGTLVGHPGLVTTAMMEFNKSMPRAHQMYYERKDDTAPSDLVRRPEGPLSTDSLLGAVRTLLRALTLRSEGVAVVMQGGRLHDRSSVRLSTVLLWSWVHSSYGVITDTGLEIHQDLVRYLIKKECEKVFGQAPPELREAGSKAAARLTEALNAAVLPHDLLD